MLVQIGRATFQPGIVLVAVVSYVPRYKGSTTKSLAKFDALFGPNGYKSSKQAQPCNAIG
jgi:hypothetical protein